ncbi:SAM-dependent methyltransferase [Nocardia sp. CA-107356]|uniref:SAM-dependent methyltransferase n=1 Tax=Nocardia sp. CA-107356 TaxID=3239972 RepID=UPI003D928E67
MTAHYPAGGTLGAEEGIPLPGTAALIEQLTSEHGPSASLDIMTAPASGRPRTPVGVDAGKPNAARLWNYLLGGKDNYGVDQQVAERMRAVAPDMRRAAWYSRRFLLKAVEDAAKAGIRQFIDIGAGIPLSTGGNDPHDVAEKIQPGVSFTAIDYDPMVFVHCNAMYNHTPSTTTVKADIRDPDAVINKLRMRGMVDFTQPTAVLMVGVLDYVTDDEDPAGIMARLRAALAPGSYLALTHASSGTCRDLMARIDADTVGSTAESVWRTSEEIDEFLDGFNVLRPGLPPVQAWLDGELRPTRLETLAAVGRV